MKRMRDFKVSPGAQHPYRVARGGLCADCGGNYDMRGHVLARRAAAAQRAAEKYGPGPAELPRRRWHT